MGPSERFRVTYDGTRLFTRRWAPAEPPKGSVCVLHGVCEHAGRYGRVADFLTSAGYAVSAFDLRGHGRSEGRRGDVRLAQALTDIDEVVQEERAQSENVFLYGQSLGGLLALTYALDRGSKLNGVVASAPVLHTALRENKAKVAAAQVLGRIAPQLGMPSGLEDFKLMRDDEVLADRRKDELVHDRVTAGAARDLLNAMGTVLQDADRFSTPLLLIHGDADEINFLSGSRAMASKVRGDCTLNIYDGVRHHPHNDPERQRIFADVITWLDAHALRTDAG